MIRTASAFDSFCLSSFLTFRYVVRETAEWAPGVCLSWPHLEPNERLAVRNANELLDGLHFMVSQATQRQPVGLLLSAGIDSAILAALLPRGTPAYTIRFDADHAVDESDLAAKYAEQCGLRHHVVTVGWDDYEERIDGLMQHKNSPLHAVEVGLALAASAAADDGVTTLLVGNGADSTFGGLDRLLSRDWTLDEFIGRYTFLEPSIALRDPVSMRPVFEEYASGKDFDVGTFLKEVHGRGIVQAFDNAIGAAGCGCVAPYESLALAVPLDLRRIRNGEPKYFLREIFKQLYPDLPLSEKIAFARPMDSWMKRWNGPQRLEFRATLDIRTLTGEQKWLLYCLERFMNLVEAD